MMLYLTLTEIPISGGPVVSLGTVKIRREREDVTTQVASYSLENNGLRLGTVQGWHQWHGPWRLAQAALGVIYGGTKLVADTQLKNNGQCNAIAKSGKRCRLDAQDGKYFCVVHARI